MKLVTCAILALVLLYVVIVSAAAVTLGISGDGRFFTIDGVPTYLNGISYYGGCQISTPSMVTQDLDDMQARGINWLRVWTFWNFNGQYAAPVTDLNGNVQEPYMSRLKNIITEANNRGMIVDVTMSRNNTQSTINQYIACAQTIATHLLPYRNVYIDIGNERDVGDSRYISIPDCGSIINAIKAIDPNRICTASGVPTSQSDLSYFFNTGRLDFIAPHLCRDQGCAAQTYSTVRTYVTWMTNLGRRAPVHLQEPFRRGYTSYNPVQEDFYRDNSGGKAAEAAGWCLHNGSDPTPPPYRSFLMNDSTGRLFSQLDSIELDVLANISDTIGGTSWTTRRYQAEYSEQLSHQIGRKEGLFWSANVAQDNTGFLNYGPYLDGIPSGGHRASWRLMIDDNTSNNDVVATLDVYANGLIAQRDVRRQEFTSANTWQTFSIDWASSGQQDLEFRTYWVDNSYLKLDHVTLDPNLDTQTPYSGAIPIPGTIQAENFDNGGQFAAYYDLSSGNSGGAYRATDVDIETTSDTGGGYNVGWIDSGEWLEYTVNVASTGDYSIKMRVASPNNGCRFRVKIDGNDISGARALESTGGWQNFTTVIIPARRLTAGQHILQVYVNTGGWNLNYIETVSNGVDAVSIDLGNIEVLDGMTHIQVGDGDTVPWVAAAHDCRENVDFPDRFMYFGVSDTWAYQGSKQDVYITCDYYDIGASVLGLDYDSTSGAYTSVSGPTLTNTLTWKTYTFHVTNAYFGNRQNGGADFRFWVSNQQEWGIDTVCVYQGGSDTTPPGNVTNFTATPGNQQVSLSWTNPTDPDFTGTKIMFKTTGYPTGPADGTQVYDSNGTGMTHTGLTNGVTCYYKAFAHDAVPNYASGAQASATPAAGDTTAPSFGGSISPSLTNSLTPTITITAQDTGVGLNVGTAEFAYSVDGGASFTTYVGRYILHSSGSGSGGGNRYWYPDFYHPTYTIASGDHLQYDIYCNNTDGKGAVDIEGSFGNLRDSGKVDQNGLSPHADTNLYNRDYHQWYHRDFDLSSWAGHTISAYEMAHETDSGASDFFVRNVIITNNGLVKDRAANADGWTWVDNTVSPINNGYSSLVGPEMLTGDPASPASCTGSNGTTAQQTVSAVFSDRLMSLLAGSNNRIKFHISDMNGNRATSGTFTINIDQTPPGNVTNFTATPGSAQVSLSWTNPGDGDFAGTLIRFKTTGYPTSASDGTQIYNSNGTSYNHTGLTNGVTYYYKAFAYDTLSNYASGAQASATPGGGPVTISNSAFDSDANGWSITVWRNITDYSYGTMAWVSGSGNPGGGMRSTGAGGTDNTDRCNREGGEIYKTISTAGYSNISVQYDLKVNTLGQNNTGAGIGNCPVDHNLIDEQITVFYSTNGGSSWTEAEYLTRATLLASYQNYGTRTINLSGVSACNNNSNFALRFRWQFNTSTDQGNLDNIKVISN